MHVIIIEDEIPAANRLEKLLALQPFPIQVLQKIDSIESAVHYFGSNPNYDLIFMDIQLADGLSFSIFEKVSITKPIIFTTAFNEYAIEAFKVNSIDYLLKPIDEDDLEVAVAKYKSRLPKQDSIQMDFDQIRKMFTNNIDKEYKTRFTIKIGQQLKIITAEEIECIYSENKGTYIHTIDNRDYLMDSIMEVIEQELNPKDFFRVSRKFIIPLKAIKEIQIYSNSRLKVILPTYKGEEVIVAREKVNAFKNWLE